MAASYDGGVVMGADSRTSTGSYIANRVTDKITPLAAKIFICRSGSAADTQNLSRYVQVRRQQRAQQARAAGRWQQGRSRGSCQHLWVLQALVLGGARALLRLRLCATVALQRACLQARPCPPCTNPHPPPNSLQWFLEQHQMELGDDAEVKTAAKLAQQMAYQNKVGVCACGWLGGWWWWRVRGGCP